MDDLFPEVIADEDPTGDERYTTRETIAWVLALLGIAHFDLDAAACEESHWAPRYFTKAQNALAQAWFTTGVLWVWLNPPYSDVEPWIERVWREMERCPVGGGLAMLIPATRTEQSWWQREIEPHRDGAKSKVDGVALSTRFLPGRTSFARPGSGGVGQSGAPFGCVLLIWRRIS